MLFVWSVSLTLENFHSFGDVTIVGEGLQILTYAWQFWPLRSEVFFVLCHTYCGTGHPRTRDTHTKCRAFGSGAVITCRGWYSNSQPSICMANSLIYCATAAGRTLGSYTQFAVCFLSYIELYHLSHITNAKNVLYFEQLFSNVEFILRATMP